MAPIVKKAAAIQMAMATRCSDMREAGFMNL
jgi:hypothetical protein